MDEQNNNNQNNNQQPQQPQYRPQEQQPYQPYEQQQQYQPYQQPQQSQQQPYQQQPYQQPPYQQQYQQYPQQQYQQPQQYQQQYQQQYPQQYGGQYPQQYGGYYPQTQTKKKSKWWVWLIVAILVLALIGVGIYFLFFYNGGVFGGNSGSPEALVGKFEKAVQKYDSKMMIECFDPTQQSKLKEQEAMLKSELEMIKMVDPDITINVLSTEYNEDKTRATMEIEIRLTGSFMGETLDETNQETVEAVLIDGEWYFPEDSGIDFGF